MHCADRQIGKLPLTRPQFTWISLFVLFVFYCLFLPGSSLGQDFKGVLRGGWYPWVPYQYLQKENDVERLTGLDIILVQAIVRNAGYDVSYDEISWKQHQLDIEQGIRDIAAGAFITPERQRYAYFTEPYREEINVLIVRRGESNRFSFKSLQKMLEVARNGRFRLGVIDGYAYASSELNRFINDSANATHIVPVGTETTNFENLMHRRIDGFFVDRIAGATLAWRNGWQSFVEEHPLPPFSNSIHVMFSKRSTSPAMVDAFNRSLSELKERGRYDRMVQQYMFPILLSMTVEQRWFFIIDIIGTIAFAISGLICARQGGYDLIGAFVLASLPATGGGIMRDLIVGRSPIAVLRTPAYLLAVVITVIAGYLALCLYSRLRPSVSQTGRAPTAGKTLAGNILQVFDAIGLSAFTVIGVVVAVESKAEPLWLWGPLLAMITGAGGGILRDVIRADADNPFLKGTCYPEIALLWGFCLSGFLIWQTSRLNPDEIFLAVIFTIGGAFLTRLGVIRFGIRSPLY